MSADLPEAERPAAARPAMAGKILIVDDEEQNRTLLRDPLEARGFQVSEAEHGLQALQQVARMPPDVILLDVMMPGMDGFEVCHRLKSDGQTAAIPILMVTALTERKERLLGIKAGANDFLNKPVDLQELLLRVENAAYTKRLFDQLQAEQKKAESLLLNILPKSVAERMKKGEANIADYCPETTVLFTDLVGFTTLSANIGPDQVVCLLNEIFSGFDTLTENQGLEKIKTIGDAYMAAGGIPRARSDHAEAVTNLALGMRQEIEKFNRHYNTSLRTRTGICTGPVVAGVIGKQKFAYDLWGHTVNLANRLAALADPGAILLADATCQRLKLRLELEHFRLSQPRTVEIKGFGPLVTCAL